jgi:O-antigen ligase
MLDLPARSWILGAGAGTFADVFKTVQPASLPKSFLYAHNDWIELLFDFGFLGLAAIGAAVALWWRKVRPERLDPLQQGALAGVLAAALHALVDYNLHVPGTAIAFWVLVGVAVNPNLTGRVERSHAG